MSWNSSRVLGCAVTLALLAGGAIAWRFAFFILPFAWTGEPEQLARALGLQRGMVVADIGAGSGALATAMAAQVGETGRVYTTELSAERRAAIEERVTSAAIDNVHVMAAKETNTGLPDQCCDAVGVFRSAGLRLRDRDDDWGGGMFLLVFERER